mmetsp:Transcript_21387/g.66359  ORF Transcript_21387/g.66359 Transcript_21387/m.66359 type:complete len:413 (+) Transcript_21387:413-1651(+)
MPIMLLTRTTSVMRMLPVTYHAVTPVSCELCTKTPRSQRHVYAWRVQCSHDSPKRPPMVLATMTPSRAEATSLPAQTLPLVLSHSSPSVRMPAPVIIVFVSVLLRVMRRPPPTSVLRSSVFCRPITAIALRAVPVMKFSLRVRYAVVWRTAMASVLHDLSMTQRVTKEPRAVSLSPGPMRPSISRPACHERSWPTSDMRTPSRCSSPILSSPIALPRQPSRFSSVQPTLNCQPRPKASWPTWPLRIQMRRRSRPTTAAVRYCLPSRLCVSAPLWTRSKASVTATTAAPASCVMFSMVRRSGASRPVLNMAPRCVLETTISSPACQSLSAPSRRMMRSPGVMADSSTVLGDSGDVATSDSRPASTVSVRVPHGCSVCALTLSRSTTPYVIVTVHCESGLVVLPTMRRPPLTWM